MFPRAIVLLVALHSEREQPHSSAAALISISRAAAPMLLWAWLVAVLTAFGVATMFLGLIVVFPLIGHATWHAYRSIVSEA